MLDDDVAAKLEVLQPSKTGTTASKASPYTVWYWVGGAVLAALALVCGVFWIGGQMSAEKTEESEESRTEEPKNEA